MKIRNLTNDQIKKILVETRPEGFTMAFAAEQPDEKDECLLKVRRSGEPWGKILIWRTTGDTVLWKEGRFGKQKSFESPETAMGCLRLLILCGSTLD